MGVNGILGLCFVAKNVTLDPTPAFVSTLCLKSDTSGQFWVNILNYIVFKVFS